MTRRDFHRHAARMAAGILLASTVADAASSQTGDDSGKLPDAQKPAEAPPTETPPPATPPADSPTPAEVTDALARVRAAAPGLPEGDMKELEAQVKSAVDLQKALRELPVPDGAEPGFVFRALLPTRKARP